VECIIQFHMEGEGGILFDTKGDISLSMKESIKLLFVAVRSSISSSRCEHKVAN
jgi:hypothetical protein